MNTEEFLWERGQSSIVIFSGGLYEISLIIITDGPSNFHIALNNEPILSPSKSISHKVADRKRYKGPVHITYTQEPAVLPPRARISVLLTGGHLHEAFLVIRKH